jgi:hypothetical protein
MGMAWSKDFKIEVQVGSADRFTSNIWRDVCFWHLADKPTALVLVGYWVHSGHRVGSGAGWLGSE